MKQQDGESGKLRSKSNYCFSLEYHLRPKLQAPCLQHCLFQGSYGGPLPAPPLPMGQRDHRAKQMNMYAESPQPLSKHTLGTQAPYNPAQMSPELTSQGAHFSHHCFQVGQERDHRCLARVTTDMCAKPSSMQNEAHMGKQRRIHASSPCRRVLAQNSEDLENSKFKLGSPSCSKSILRIIHSPLLLGTRNPALAPSPEV